MNRHCKLLQITVLSLALILSGCSAVKVYDENKEIGHLAAVTGRTITPGTSQSIIVALQNAESGKVEDAYAQPYEGYFLFMAPPGRYRVAAFIDRNDDFTHQAESEEAAQSALLELKAGDFIKYQNLLLKAGAKAIPGALKEIVIGGDTGDDFANFSIGNVVSLDDSRFSQTNASTGLWRPMTFLREQRPGIYFLEPYLHSWHQRISRRFSPNGQGTRQRALSALVRLLLIGDTTKNHSRLHHALAQHLARRVRVQ